MALYVSLRRDAKIGRLWCICETSQIRGVQKF